MPFPEKQNKILPLNHHLNIQKVILLTPGHKYILQFSSFHVFLHFYSKNPFSYTESPASARLPANLVILLYSSRLEDEPNTDTFFTHNPVFAHRHIIIYFHCSCITLLQVYIPHSANDIRSIVTKINAVIFFLINIFSVCYHYYLYLTHFTTLDFPFPSYTSVLDSFSVDL